MDRLGNQWIASSLRSSQRRENGLLPEKATPKRTSVPQRCGTHSSGKISLSTTRLLGGRRSLAFHIDDLDAAVDLRGRLAGILELALAVSDGHEVGAGNAVFVDQIFLDRIGAPLRQVLIV